MLLMLDYNADLALEYLGGVYEAHGGLLDLDDLSGQGQKVRVLLDRSLEVGVIVHQGQL